MRTIILFYKWTTLAHYLYLYGRCQKLFRVYCICHAEIVVWIIHMSSEKCTQIFLHVCCNHYLNWRPELIVVLHELEESWCAYSHDCGTQGTRFDFTLLAVFHCSWDHGCMYQGNRANVPPPSLYRKPPRSKCRGEDELSKQGVPLAAPACCWYAACWEPFVQ